MEQIDEVADEIVIAADSRVGEDDLRWYRSVADRVLSVEFKYLERHLGWLHAQCRGDWALRLDGDEVVGGALRSALPDLISSREFVQHAFSRRWLMPDGEDWIAEAPWFPDLQVRLARNDATLRFDGGLHTSAAPRRPNAFAFDLPIYHLSLAGVDESERMRKALRYELTEGGILAGTGEGLSGRVCLPELNQVETRPVPEADRESITRVLLAGQRDPGPARAPAPEVTPLYVSDRYWARSPMSDADHRAEIRLMEEIPRLTCDERRGIYIAVRNLGSVTWPWGDDVPPQVRVAHRWVGADGLPTDPDLPDWHRQLLPCNVPPGAEVTVPIEVAAPGSPGRYELELDLVNEFVRWFGIACRLRFDVVKPVGANAGAPGRDSPQSIVLVDLSEPAVGARPNEVVAAWTRLFGDSSVRRVSVATSGSAWDALEDGLQILVEHGGVLAAAACMPSGGPFLPAFDDGLVALDDEGRPSPYLFAASAGGAFAMRLGHLARIARSDDVDVTEGLRAALAVAATGDSVKRTSLSALVSTWPGGIAAPGAG